MKFYNAKVQLGGSVLNEVVKENLSAAEVVLLRRIHGEASVIDVTSTKTPEVPSYLDSDQWDDDTVRRHLTAQYGVDNDSKVDRVIATFGVPGVPLPTSVDAKAPEKRLDEETVEKIRAEERAKLEAEFAVRDRKAEEMPAAAQIKENKAAGVDPDLGLNKASQHDRKAKSKAIDEALK